MLTDDEINEIWHVAANSDIEGDIVSKFARAIEQKLYVEGDAPIQRLSETDVMLRFSSKEECDYFLTIADHE